MTLSLALLIVAGVSGQAQDYDLLRERLSAEMTLKDGKVVYDLNALSGPDWNTLPPNYGATGDR